MTFRLEYEVLIGELKSDFLACRQWELLCAQPGGAVHRERLEQQQLAWRHKLALLRRRVREQFGQFDARAVSSLLALPARPLADSELLIHRIWLGGALPDGARQAVCQWGAALDETGPPRYTSVLWVWDAAQLHGDPLFRPHGHDGSLGAYACGGYLLDVRGLAALTGRCSPALAPCLARLNDARCFVNLSDYLRILVLREHGGIYLDADTMPYRPATAFLARPEVPDYVQFSVTDGQLEASHVSWLNLIHDENAVLVARRGDAAVAALADTMATALAALADPAQAGALQQATYYLWRRQVGRTLLAYHDMSLQHCVLQDCVPERIAAGVQGMRLRRDADTGAPLPLSAQEATSYRGAVAALDALDWRLPDPAALPAHVTLDWVSEVPRMAYAPQLRAQPETCNYYSFLCDDPWLDRVNALFAAWLLGRNGARIAAGGFWQPTRGSAAYGPVPRTRRELLAHG